MPLKAKGRPVRTFQSLQRAVKQTDVGRAQIGRQSLLIDRKSMVLTGDADAPAIEVLDRMVGAVVTKLPLEGPGATG